MQQDWLRILNTVNEVEPENLNEQPDLESSHIAAVNVSLRSLFAHVAVTPSSRVGKLANVMSVLAADTDRKSLRLDIRGCAGMYPG